MIAGAYGCWNPWREQCNCRPDYQQELRSMLGNVREWVADCYRLNYTDAHTEGSAFCAETYMKRISHGGSWNIFIRKI